MLLKRFFVSMLGSLAAIWISLMLVILLGMCFAISSLISSFTDQDKASVEEHSILQVDLSGEIVEQLSVPTFSDVVNGVKAPTVLGNIIDALAAAKTDDKIDGVVISCKGSAAGIATREAIREAIADFKTSGKWVIAYGDSYAQADYYIASVADEVFINPVGELTLNGLASGIPFFKGLLDKLGVEVQVVKVGTFKSAVEPFILNNMSEANRLQTQVYLDGIWGEMVKAIAESRKLTPEKINLYADSLMTFVDTQKLVDLKLVDGLKYENEYTDYLKDKTEKKHDDDLNIVSVSQYLKGAKVPNTKENDNKIAIYYACGDITEDGKEGIASSRVVPDILELADDDDIEAMVLRVNSGGGSAFASEQIWHSIEVFKSKGKKVYVSMGDYAASGGYYISCNADKIYAQPTTLTGSIGIFGMIPCFNGLVSDKLGVNVDYVTTNTYGAQPNSFYPMSAPVRAKMQDMVNRGYELFTSRCADGRHMPQDSIKAIAEGRVWDGISAKRIGLVDELGSLNQAVKALAAEMGYKKYEVVNYPESKTNFWEIFSEFSTQMKASAVKEELGEFYPAYEQVKRIAHDDPIQARMDLQVIY